MRTGVVACHEHCVGRPYVSGMQGATARCTGSKCGLSALPGGSRGLCLQRPHSPKRPDGHRTHVIRPHTQRNVQAQTGATLYGVIDGSVEYVNRVAAYAATLATGGSRFVNAPHVTFDLAIVHQIEL